MLYLLASLENYEWITNPFWNKAVLFLAMAVGMTLIEYVAGLFCLKFLKVRLWDYSNLWGNVQGILYLSGFLCRMGCSGGTVLLSDSSPHPGGLEWLSQNLAFSFFIGVFFGVFAVDVAHSAQLVAKLKHFAEEYTIVLAYEEIKAHIRRAHLKNAMKYHSLRRSAPNTPSLYTSERSWSPNENPRSDLALSCFFAGRMKPGQFWRNDTNENLSRWN